MDGALLVGIPASLQVSLSRHANLHALPHCRLNLPLAPAPAPAAAHLPATAIQVQLPGWHHHFSQPLLASRPILSHRVYGVARTLANLNSTALPVGCPPTKLQLCLPARPSRGVTKSGSFQQHQGRFTTFLHASPLNPPPPSIFMSAITSNKIRPVMIRGLVSSRKYKFASRSCCCCCSRACLPRA